MRRLREPAVAAFALLALVAVPLLLVLGRNRWFHYDEWDLLASRDLSEPTDLFEPHNVHWSTLPILAYRVMWGAFGLNTYVPYQLLNILSHLAVVTLVLVVMRRAGVRPWVATGAAVLLLFLGSGDEDLFWAFQITFNGSLAFGLLQLVLADHDGPIDRRDWLGLAAGFAGLLCSGIAVTMVVVVGIAALLRRGWRVALFHTAPLAAAYALWYVLASSGAYRQPGPTNFDQNRDMFVELVSGLGLGLARTPVLAWLLLVVLAGGLFLAWWPRRERHDPDGWVDPEVEGGEGEGDRWEVRGRAAVPAALLVGAMAFIVITAAGRAGASPDVAANNRYVYVPAVLLMPALAIAIDALLQRWRVAIVGVAALALVALVGNARDLDDDQDLAVEFARGFRSNILMMPRVARADDVPPSLHPELPFAPWINYRWLRAGVDAGKIPEPPERNAVVDATLEAGLLLHLQPHDGVTCEAQPSPAEVDLAAGSSVLLAGPVTITYVADDGTESAPLPFAPFGSTTDSVVSYADDVHVRIDAAPATEVQVCDLDGGPFVVQDGP